MPIIQNAMDESRAAGKSQLTVITPTGFYGGKEGDKMHTYIRKQTWQKYDIREGKTITIFL